LKEKLPQSVVPALQKFHQSLVTQHLQLLPNLVPHMTIIRMQSAQLALFRVNIIEHKLRSAQRAHDRKHIQSPSTFLDVQIRQWPEMPELAPHIGRPLRNATHYDGNPGDIGNVRKNDVATHPPRAARSGAERLAFLGGRFRKSQNAVLEAHPILATDRGGSEAAQNEARGPT
jgi:hypothetical protein